MRGSIERRGPATWRLRVYVGRVDGKRRWKTKTVHGSKADADEHLARFVLENTGRLDIDREVTFAELVGRWHDERSRTLSPATVASDSSYRSTVCRFLGDRHIRSITAADVADVDRILELDGYSSSHRRATRRHIVGALDRAVEWGWVAANPTGRTKPPTVKARKIDPPTLEQIQAIIDAAEQQGPASAALVRLAATVGPRRGELCGLRFSDFDDRSVLIERSISAGRGVIDAGDDWSTVPGSDSTYVGPTKTGTSRRVAVDDRTRQAVDDLYRWAYGRYRSAAGTDPRLEPGAYLFATDPDSLRPWHPSTVARRFTLAQVAAGLSGWRIHDLRHGVATRLIAAGYDPVTVAGRLGHASPKMTLDVYSHFVPARDDGAAGLLGSQLS